MTCRGCGDPSDEPCEKCGVENHCIACCADDIAGEDAQCCCCGFTVGASPASSVVRDDGRLYCLSCG